MRNKIRNKITSTLRGKLSLWYLVSVGLIILLFLAASSILFWITLQDQIDHHVHIAVNEASQIVQNFQSEQRDELIKNLVSAQGMTVVVLSPDGAPLLETNSPDVALVTEHALQKILSSSSLYESSPVHFTESNIRFAAVPVMVSAGKGIVAVGYSTQVLYATFMKMLLVVAGIVIFLVLPITFVGYKFLKKQLQPLETIAREAEAVSSTSSLSKRIRVTASTTELTSITTALNSMLTRLEEVFNNQQEFFSDAAHTLKTPLAVLRSQVENSGISLKSKNELLTTIDSTNDTVQDLLFLSKIGDKTQNVTSFSLSELLGELVELATTLGEDKKLKVTADISKNINYRADKKLLLRALSNIVHNAVLYNKPGGIIRISLSKQKNRVIIRVRDTGVGIVNNERSQLFTRFFRGSNIKSKGSGLGLSITKAVVENLNGAINIKSSLNKGTTVTITFS